MCALHTPSEISVPVTDASTHFTRRVYYRPIHLDDHGHRQNLRRRRQRHSHIHDPHPDYPRLACRSHAHSGITGFGLLSSANAPRPRYEYLSLYLLSCLFSAPSPRGDCNHSDALCHYLITSTFLAVTISTFHIPQHYLQPQLFSSLSDLYLFRPGLLFIIQLNPYSYFYFVRLFL